MISVVLDTNTLASGTLTASTPPGQILNAWRMAQFSLILSESILNELERTLHKPYFLQHLKGNEIAAFLDLLRDEAIITPIAANISGVATHPEDDLVLATAISGKADYLVTGDGAFLRAVGPNYRGVNIVTPHTFLTIIQETKSK